MPTEIDSDKILIKDVFTRWFRVPEYQRPYVWDKEQVGELLEDVADACQDRPNSQYFLGSIVFQSKDAKDSNGSTYEENDLLDGQQRLTTCLMLLAVARDLTQNVQLKEMCRNAVFQEQNLFAGIPERLRIVYDIRPEVREFVKKYIKPEGGTTNEAELKDSATKADDVSVRQMARAILQIRTFFNYPTSPSLEQFFIFFLTKVLLVYVSSPSLDDAFRLFTVLNDRGMKLRNSDILKSLNLRALDSQGVSADERKDWAKLWEDTENELGEDFDTFLSHLRTVLVKERAKTTLLQEFEDVIYKKNLLAMGKSTFDFIKSYREHYDTLLSGSHQSVNGDFTFDNLTALLLTSPADFWLPPLLQYRQQYGDTRIQDFLKKLENKFSADWILRETPTVRIENMNRVLRRMDELQREGLPKPDQIDKLLSLNVFDFNGDSVRQRLRHADMYGAPYCTYLLYKLDMIVGGPVHKLQPPQQISVEHILPQSPKAGSQWKTNFTDADHQEWVHKLGNLVLIGRRKNTSMGRLDFDEKKKRYFSGHIQSFPNSLRLMQKTVWDLPTLKANHEDTYDRLEAYYGL